MCGICGVINFRDKNRVDINVMNKMLSKLSHRGPDGSDVLIKGNMGLGFCRLGIIDLKGGMQPLSNEDNTVYLVCNGEIFNYLEIKDSLIKKGHIFKTKTDIEVILHLYEEFGTEFINTLNGQFSFAIYDSRNKMLLCARDHAGVAPFFYTVVKGSFIFASEIKAILEYTDIKKEVDLIGLDQMLTFPGLIGSRTMFKNIKSLESGNYLILKDSGDLNITEYWDLKYPKMDEIEYLKDENYYIEKLDFLLNKSIKYRLQADVPVGFYISGGLDSSIIASKVMSISNDKKRQSFAIDFDKKEISESRYQDMLVNHVLSQHHSKLLQIDDICNKLQKAVYHSETPLKETYNTASFTLSEMMHENNIKVALAGQGADELFAGYVGYRFDKLRQQDSLQNRTELDFREYELRNELWGDKNFFYEKDYYSFRNTKLELYSNLCNEVYSEIDCLRHNIVNKELLEGLDIIHKRSYIDFKLRLPEHLLADHGDRMAYANSVEVRYPFLDKDLMEFCVKIPPNLKLKDFNEKYILKKLATGLVPQQIVKRPKFSFVAPGSPELLKKNYEFISDLLSYDRIKRQGYFDPNTVEKLKNNYLKEGFKLNLPFENDLLIIVITFGLFMESFGMPSL